MRDGAGEKKGRKRSGRTGNSWDASKVSVSFASRLRQRESREKGVFNSLVGIGSSVSGVVEVISARERSKRRRGEK